MKRFILLFISFACVGAQLTLAQSYVVKGKVVSSEGNEPLIGVAIMQEGRSYGVVTDFDGNYAIEIKGDEGVDLRFSYIGMQSQLHQVTSKSNVLILL